MVTSKHYLARGFADSTGDARWRPTADRLKLIADGKAICYFGAVEFFAVTRRFCFPRLTRYPRQLKVEIDIRSAVYSALVLGLSLAGAEAEAIDFEREIKPLLTEKCGACHGALQQEAGLRVDAGVLIHRGGDGGDVIVPGKPDESLLIEKVATTDPDLRMPPEGQGAALDAAQIRLLREWITDGAPIPDQETIPADPSEHWAYQVPIRPGVPEVIDDRWSHPIDAFVAAEHQHRGLVAVDLADRYTLLRRAYFDLVGLPPSPKQIDAFVHDDSPGAWERLVDELLESPQHGERWARHWMDVWRYSDWDGYKQQLRGSQRHIWRWRDWMVQSLNQDKGYDRMVVEMLAGDEVAPGDSSILPATGFLARNYHKSNRNIWLDATVEHTAKAFLGTTLNCARCHDHKYDPIGQPEYYQFRAIFEPHNVRTDRIPGQPNLMQDGLPRAYDAEPAAETFLYHAGNEKHPDKDHPMTSAVPAALGGTFEVQPIELPVADYYPALRQFAAQEDLAKARRQLAAARKALSNNDNPTTQLKYSAAQLAVESLEARQAADAAKYGIDSSADTGDQQRQLALVAAQTERRLDLSRAALTLLEKETQLAAAEASDEKDAKKKKTAIDTAKKAVADAEKKVAELGKQQFLKNDGKYTPLGKEYPRESTGRRLALARWITSPSNPLTARVAVNHIWLRHFGEPLVENVFDFGLRTPRPRHADLLDWLAVELMESGWSMKHLHRLIVTSRTWRLASSTDSMAESDNTGIDPDNHYHWRANVRRLDAEVIRDSVLAVTGRLDTSLGGADIDYQKGEETPRRSIYIRHAYEKQMTMLVLFDAASPTECYRRSESIIPQQALALANSSLTLSQTRLLARELWSQLNESDEDRPRQFVEQAYRQILARPASDQELMACLTFLSEQSKLLADPSQLTTFVGGEKPKVAPAEDAEGRARENLVHVLVNHNDFVTVR